MLTATLSPLLDPQAVSSAPASAAAPGGLHELTGFVALDQNQGNPNGNPNWCWAAVAAMVYRHYSNQPLSPCAWATICIGDPKIPDQCCHRPSYCDRAYPILFALRGMLGTASDGPLGPEAIKVEIDARPGRPIVCIQRAAAHVVVIYGLDEPAPGQAYVLSIDPAGATSSRTEIQEFIDRPDAGWSATILTHSPAPGGP